jgi:hypothetical protein
MRTQIEVTWPFSNQDISWITQEVCEAYAGSTLKGRKRSDETALMLANNSYTNAALLKQILEAHPDFLKLRDDLIDEFGIEHFIRPKTHLEHIRDIEERMEGELDNAVYAKLMKELRELRAWSIEKPPSLPNSNNVTNNLTLNQFNVDGKDVGRVYHSLMG